MTMKKIRAGAALLFLLSAGGGYGQEDLPLVNTRTVSLEGVDSLSISYGSDDFVLRKSDSGDLVIREYMERDRPRYYAEVTRSGDTVQIRRGRRPLTPWLRRARAEIYLPPAFRGNFRLVNSSGNIRGETDILDCKTIDIYVDSGSAFLGRLSAETVSVRVSSGDLDIRALEGGSFVSVSSGTLRIGEMTGPEHRLKDSSGRVRIGLLRGGSSVETNSGRIAVERAQGRMEAHTSNGSITVGDFSGEGSFETNSGRIAVERARGRVEAHTSSGSITVGDFSGEGSFETDSGRIHLDLRELAGDLRVTLSSGRVEMNLPGGIPFTLDAVTGSGKVLISEGGGEALRISGDNSTVLRPFGPPPGTAGAAGAARTIRARLNSGTLSINRK
jgi:DUF4097 and DUF4098 domain-containing protein YvlB